MDPARTFVTNAGRANGKTTALIIAAKQTGATIVCHTAYHAHYLRSKHGVDAISLLQFEERRIVSSDRPVVFDSDAIAEMIRSAVRRDRSRIQGVFESAAYGRVDPMIYERLLNGIQERESPPWNPNLPIEKIPVIGGAVYHQPSLRKAKTKKAAKRSRKKK